jgi:hypothetical protein
LTTDLINHGIEFKEKCHSVSDGMIDDIKKSGATLG